MGRCVLNIFPRHQARIGCFILYGLVTERAYLGLSTKDCSLSLKMQLRLSVETEWNFSLSIVHLTPKMPVAPASFRFWYLSTYSYLGDSEQHWLS